VHFAQRETPGFINHEAPDSETALTQYRAKAIAIITEVPAARTITYTTARRTIVSPAPAACWAWHACWMFLRSYAILNRKRCLIDADCPDSCDLHLISEGQFPAQY
jgi:hypothetical protein